MLPAVQKFILPSLLAFLTALTMLFSSHKQLPVQKHTPHKTAKVLGMVLRPTPTSPVKENQRADQLRIIPTTAVGKSTNFENNSENSAVGISPTLSSVVPDPSVAPIPSPTSTPSMQNTTIYAKTTITASGKTIHLSMQYPSLGGPITGTISGDCTGNLSGTYAGPATGILNGTGTATCPMGFLSIPVSLTYTGKLISPTLAAISYTATAVGKTEKGSTNLTLSQ